VQLRPDILKQGQDAVKNAYGDDAGFWLVFHGGSGSSREDIQTAIQYGVVKMNVDTDTQYAFTRVVAGHMLENYDGVLKIDGEVGQKKVYDPRSYLKKAEKAMTARVMQAVDDLNAEGTSLFGK
jgi:fructose-bisphosphate aldolase class II